jgi:predicted  nucleic acid-binding Zn-ribbon protein
VKAPPQAQRKLLDLAGLDAELARLEQRQRTLPEIAEFERLQARDRELRDDLASLEAHRADLHREQLRAERDVDQVRARMERDRARLDAGQVSSPRDLENLQSEIASLERRQADLEDAVLAVMERSEEADRRQQALLQEQAALASQREQVAARRDAALSEIAELAAKARDDRARIAAEVPADLLGLYDRIRAQHTVGAAALRQGRCEGCHLSLNTVDLGRIRAAPPDEVIRCEECRRILVRLPGSGP